MADWSKIASRGNIEDRRGLSMAIGGGLGTIGVLAVLAFNLFTGSNIDPALVEQTLDQLNQLQPNTQQSQLQPEQFQGADQYEVFASTVLGSSNDVWNEVFSQSNQQYKEPRLVLFRGATTSAAHRVWVSFG